ncbi:MAG: glycosyltransferase family 2 protein [Candidatus Melainabacteria bacterium]|nr:glycosyltransferase family 2 protein [Candidatus Melainabacteria bacterium]
MDFCNNLRPKIAIIILNWNGKADTLACLESLTHVTYPHFTTLLVDNGSTDDSIPSIRAHYPDLTILPTGSNLGFAEGNNFGIRAALQQAPDFILLLNNDTLVAPDFLDRFVETFQAHPEAGILGAKIFLYDLKTTLDHLGGMWNPRTGTFTFIGLREQEDGTRWQTPEEIDYVCGAALMFRASLIQTIGYLEPRYFLIWEESDFCFRARRAGHKTLTCPSAKIWHKVSASFTGGKPHSTYFWWRNRLLWIERNSPPREKFRLFLLVLLPDVLHMLKIRLLKSTQLFFTKLFSPSTDTRQKEEKLMKNRAALTGVRDYILRRFGNGPSWIYKK